MCPVDQFVCMIKVNRRHRQWTQRREDMEVHAIGVVRDVGDQPLLDE